MTNVLLVSQIAWLPRLFGLEGSPGRTGDSKYQILSRPQQTGHLRVTTPLEGAPIVSRGAAISACPETVTLVAEREWS